jgi:2-dehydro-3-deoxygalactonokinase
MSYRQHDTMTNHTPVFFSCDWGTTHLRIRKVQTGDLHVLQEVKTAEGAAMMHRQSLKNGEDLSSAYERTLRQSMLPILASGPSGPEQIVISGMATSTIGWQHVDYTTLPTPMDGSALPLKKRLISITEERQAEVYFVGGLLTGNDILRGEEVEAIGLFTLLPDLFGGSARLILPGTHCKHMTISEGAITTFHTFMTGELFEHLAGMPTLAPCLQKGRFTGDEPAFLDGVQAGAARGINALFQARSRTVLKQINQKDASAFLSGICIGTELAALGETRAETLILAASPPLSGLYLSALQAIGRPDVQIVEKDIMEKAVPAGHRRLLAFQRNRFSR